MGTLRKSEASLIDYLASSITNIKLTKILSHNPKSTMIPHNTNSLSNESVKPISLNSIHHNGILLTKHQSNSSNQKLPQTNEPINYVSIIGLIISMMSLGIADIDLKHKEFN